MHFTADKQTLADLNMLGKYKPGSIYHFYNKVHTKGGEKILESMFNMPLLDHEEINKRSSIFQYFQNKQYHFPFNRNQLEIVENYLNVADSGSFLKHFVHFSRKKLLHLIIKDEAYSLMLEGLQSCIEVIHKLNIFIDSILHTGSDNPYFEKLKEATTILRDKRLSLIDKNVVLRNQPLTKQARYNYILTHQMQGQLRVVFEILYELDVYITISNIAREKNFSYATAVPEKQAIYKATDIKHPLLPNAIGNSISLTGSSNVLFLTGANMAGKSTLMKTLGISLYLAHMGFPVAAKEMVCSIKSSLHSSINIADDLGAGLSHFYAEVLRVNTVAQEVSGVGNLLVIFDELFKGTNVKDAYDATLAVTAAFSKYRNCFFIISTHIVEVGEALREKCENVQFEYLPTIMEGDEPKYTYTLREGISDDRHGMMIIEREGVLKMISNRSPN